MLADTVAKIGVYKIRYSARIAQPFRQSQHGRVDIDRGYRVLGTRLVPFIVRFR